MIATDPAALAANGFRPPTVGGMDADGHEWVIKCYAPAMASTTDTITEATGWDGDRSARVAGAILARWTHLDPPLAPDLLER